jgi:hypothetical protein
MSGTPEEIEKGLAHVIGHQGGGLNNTDSATNRLLHGGKMEPWWALSFISDHYLREALIAWFRDKDLRQFRQASYLAAKAEYLSYRYISTFPAYAPLWPLLSNNPQILQRLIEVSPFPYLEERGQRTSAIEYWFLTVALCLKGEWARVVDKCEFILANPPRKAWLKYQIDYEILLAIAKKDKVRAENALNVLVSPKMQRVRNYEEPFGYTGKFIGTHAVTYAKLAWFHGLNVEVDTPSIPREWLPMEPEPVYLESNPALAKIDLSVRYQPPAA